MSRPKHSDIALTISIIGALSAVALIVFGDTSALNEVWVNRYGLVVVAGVGAWCSGLACGGLFGHPGFIGWVLLALGAVVSTLLGAAIAGTVIIPAFGTLMAPVILVEEGFANPMMLICWAIMMVGIHIVILKSSE